MLRRQEWMREYLIEQGQPRLGFVGESRPDDSASQVAAHMRENLGVGDAWAKQHATWTGALAALIDLVEHAGILVVSNGIVGNNTHRALDPEEFRGFVLTDDYAPLVFINGADGKAAQMFTLAHELAHVWFAQSAAFDLRDMQPASEAIEQACNRVAAEFLVPEAEMRLAWPAVRGRRAVRRARAALQGQRAGRCAPGAGPSSSSIDEDSLRSTPTIGMTPAVKRQPSRAAATSGQPKTIASDAASAKPLCARLEKADSCIATPSLSSICAEVRSPAMRRDSTPVLVDDSPHHVSRGCQRPHRGEEPVLLLLGLPGLLGCSRVALGIGLCMQCGRREEGAPRRQRRSCRLGQKRGVSRGVLLDATTSTPWHGTGAS